MFEFSQVWFQTLSFEEFHHSVFKMGVWLLHCTFQPVIFKCLKKQILPFKHPWSARCVCNKRIFEDYLWKKTAGKRVCVECSLFHQESCTQILRNELSQLTGTFSLLNNHCSLIGTTPASSSALASSRTFRLPQQEEKPSLLAPCKAQQQQGKHFLHCCC